MIFYPLALAISYLIFRAVAPPQAQRALGRARVADWAAGALCAGAVALAVAL